jgi:2-isopropylmalate synthase
MSPTARKKQQGPGGRPGKARRGGRRPARRTGRKRADVLIYDTTLRDGAQAEGISFSLEDKLDIARQLDDLGVSYIEGGWPGSNPKDMAFFKAVPGLGLRQARITAFGSTRKAGSRVAADPNIRALIAAATPTVTVFGKSWRLHVTEALRTSLAENLRMIRDSVHYLKYHCEEVIYDAEHFFDGYRHDPDYALKTLDAAAGAGADWVVLCDTNGGSLPEFIAGATARVAERLELPVGIHCHNDSGMAAACTAGAVRAGARLVQGTVNGMGERCGNADLITILPVLQLKMGISCLPAEKLARLTAVSRYVFETANLHPVDNQPFVGRSAFAHKGGVHVSAVNRDARTYEHVPPESVGNARRVLVSELSGRSNILALVGDRYDLRSRPEAMKRVLDRVQELENQGYQFEAAEASFDLLLRKTMNDWQPFFKVLGFRASSDFSEDGTERTEATLRLEVDGQLEHTASEGNGPVHALDGAMRKALEGFYPELREVQLVDFKVRVINAKEATGAMVRVTIESSDGRSRWNTVGVSENIILASWRALVDSVEYKLLKERPAGRRRTSRCRAAGKPPRRKRAAGAKRR